MSEEGYETSEEGAAVVMVVAEESEEFYLVDDYDEGWSTAEEGEEGDFVKAVVE